MLLHGRSPLAQQGAPRCQPIGSALLLAGLRQACSCSDVRQGVVPSTQPPQRARSRRLPCMLQPQLECPAPVVAHATAVCTCLSKQRRGSARSRHPRHPAPCAGEAEPCGSVVRRTFTSGGRAPAGRGKGAGGLGGGGGSGSYRGAYFAAMARRPSTLGTALLCFLLTACSTAGQPEVLAPAPAPDAGANGTALNSTVSQQQLLTFCIPSWQPLVSVQPDAAARTCWVGSAWDTLLHCCAISPAIPLAAVRSHCLAASLPATPCNPP